MRHPSIEHVRNGDLLVSIWRIAGGCIVDEAPRSHEFVLNLQPYMGQTQSNKRESSDSDEEDAGKRKLQRGSGKKNRSSIAELRRENHPRMASAATMEGGKGATTGSPKEKAAGKGNEDAQNSIMLVMLIGGVPVTSDGHRR